MREVVCIRLGSHYHEPVHWLVWSEESHQASAQGVLTDAGALASLSSWVQGRPVRVSVPGCDILFKTVSFPGNLTPQSMKALAFLLEDDLACEPESLHLVVLHRHKETLQLAAVSQQQMTLWLNWLSAAQITPSSLSPDVLALPLSDATTWAAVQLGPQWLLRQSAYQGVVLEPELLAVWLAGHPAEAVIESYSPHLAMTTPCWQPQPECAALHLMAQYPADNATNLLQGSFKPASVVRDQVMKWRIPVLLALVWLVLQGANVALSWYQLEQHKAALQQQMQTVYRQTFPAEKRVVNPYVQFKQHQTALTVPEMQSGFLPSLAQVSQTVAAQKGLTVRRLSFDDKTQQLQLQLEGNSFDSLQQLKAKSWSHMQAELSALSQQNGKVSGVLTLKAAS